MLESFAAEIRTQIEALLNDNRVYALSAHGWLDADTEDPEFVGHAMWQTASLSFRYADAVFSAVHSNAPPPKLLEEWEKFLIVAGGDFEGLIGAARNSIGLMLLNRNDPRKDDEDSFFHTHLMQAIMTLSVASDRIRDVFVATAFQKTSSEYKEGKFEGQPRSHFQTPFLEAKSVHHGRLIDQSLAELPSLADNIHAFRDRRNEIVHEIATEIGRQSKERVSRPPPNPADLLEWETVYKQVIEQVRKDELKNQHNLNVAMRVPIDWYQQLMVFSNHVFIAHNHL